MRVHLQNPYAGIVAAANTVGNAISGMIDGAEGASSAETEPSRAEATKDVERAGHSPGGDKSGEMNVKRSHDVRGGGDVQPIRMSQPVQSNDSANRVKQMQDVKAMREENAQYTAEATFRRSVDTGRNSKDAPSAMRDAYLQRVERVQNKLHSGWYDKEVTGQYNRFYETEDGRLVARKEDENYG